MSCPHFKEGTFGICVAPDAIHVPSIAEMEEFCFRTCYESCPHLTGKEYFIDAERVSHCRTVRSAQKIQEHYTNMLQARRG